MSLQAVVTELTQDYKRKQAHFAGRADALCVRVEDEVVLPVIAELNRKYGTNFAIQTVMDKMAPTVFRQDPEQLYYNDRAILDFSVKTNVVPSRHIQYMNIMFRENRDGQIALDYSALGSREQRGEFGQGTQEAKAQLERFIAKDIQSGWLNLPPTIILRKPPQTANLSTLAPQ